MSIELWVYPTLLESSLVSVQNIWTWGEEFRLSMEPTGKLRVGKVCFHSSNLAIRKWYQVCVIFQWTDGTVTLRVCDKEGRLLSEECQNSGLDITLRPKGKFGLATGGTWNGKLEHPRILDASGKVLLEWRTWLNMSGWKIPSQSQYIQNLPPGYDLELVHHPTRAMKGYLWDGTEQCWNHKPSHYGAIYFHEDDGYDFGWEPDFEWIIPDDIPSGIYLVNISARDEATQTLHSDSLPIFVCPKKPLSKLCVLVSSFTYVMYGNHGRSDFDANAFAHKKKNKEWRGVYPYNAFEYPRYRQSTYNFHSDGSGIHYASHKRPLFTLRPGYISLAHTSCSGLRHFPADSHLIAYLHHQQAASASDESERNLFDYEIITDHELHTEGVACLEGYTTIVTGTHPEYHTLKSLQALQDFRDKFHGNLVYLGGNGFYWRIGASGSAEELCEQTNRDDLLHLLEIRRAEDGVRTWASECGEYYHSLEESCTYGGLWRRNGRPPQKLVGVGFSSQGSFQGMPYHRNLSLPTYLFWIMEGIPTDQRLLGNFGLSGNGAAGFELDRVDRLLDNLEDSEFIVPLTIVAQARGKDPGFIMVPEEVLTTYSNTSGLSDDDAKRADMIYFRLKRYYSGSKPEGGPGAQVFSVGSITFCGSLPWNDFKNEIAMILTNVLKQFVSENKEMPSS